MYTKHTCHIYRPKTVVFIKEDSCLLSIWTHFLGEAFGCGFIRFGVVVGKIRAVILFPAVNFVGLSNNRRFWFFPRLFSSVGRRNICLFVLYNRHSDYLQPFALKVLSYNASCNSRDKELSVPHVRAEMQSTRVKDRRAMLPHINKSRPSRRHAISFDTV